MNTFSSGLLWQKSRPLTPLVQVNSLHHEGCQNLAAAFPHCRTVAYCQHQIGGCLPEKSPALAENTGVECLIRWLDVL